MRKKAWFVIAALTCLNLAQVGVTLWSTFNAGGERWKLELYSLLVPSVAIDWLTHAIAIAFVVVLAVTLRHRWGVGVFGSFILASGLGALIVPLFFSVVHTLAFGHYGPDDYLHKTLGEAFASLVFRVTMTQQAMIGHAITASLAAIFGLAFGRNLTTDAPGGLSALGAIVTSALDIVRRLRKRDTEAMLKTIEA